MEIFTLNNGIAIPAIGFGTWKTTGNEAIQSIKTALRSGYRHIDTAAMYENEKEVGVAIKESGLSRDEIFITSKLLPQDRGYQSTLQAFKKTKNALGLDYLDLYLIHWPANARSHADWQRVNMDTWKALEELHTAGEIRSIGVSNFLPHHLDTLLEHSKITPAVNQVEYHPGYRQQDIIEYCKPKNILIEAWSPLGRARVLENTLLNTIAAKYSRSPAQICIKWCLQNGTLPLPKSSTPERIIQNADVFDFTLDNSDMLAIDGMPQTGYSGLHPDEMVF